MTGDPRMRLVARTAAVCALLVVAAAFVYSYAQIVWVSDRLLGAAVWRSYLLGFVVDLPAFVCSLLTVVLRDEPRRTVRAWPWIALGGCVAVSWLCNGLHAQAVADAGGAFPTAAAWGLAGIAPVGLVLASHLWCYALRHCGNGADVQVPAPVLQPPAPAPVAAPVTAPPAADPAPTSAPEPAAAALTAEEARAAAYAAYAALRDADEPAGATAVWNACGRVRAINQVRRWMPAFTEQYDTEHPVLRAVRAATD